MVSTSILWKEEREYGVFNRAEPWGEPLEAHARVKADSRSSAVVLRTPSVEVAHELPPGDIPDTRVCQSPILRTCSSSSKKSVRQTKCAVKQLRRRIPFEEFSLCVLWNNIICYLFILFYYYFFFLHHW
jgi:hypothetical protein